MNVYIKIIIIFVLMAAGLQPVVGGNRIRPLPAITPIKQNAEIKKECVMKKIDLTGHKFGRLTVIEYAGKDKGRNSMWRCKCDCGNETISTGYSLKSGHTQSCGCLRIEHSKEANITHNMTSSSEYNIWQGIKDRCSNSNNPAYKNYGGRGIKVCERWLNSFEDFYKDMRRRPSKEYSIDRIDNNKGYFPENCRWVTRKEQNNNTRHNHNLTYNGKTQTITQWEEELGFNKGVIKQRVNKSGWSTEKALTTPVVEVRNEKITFNGVTKTIRQWANDLGINYNTLYSRITKYGWSIEKALTT